MTASVSEIFDPAAWTEVPWDEVYPRLSPGTMDEYTTTFEAPSAELTLFIRGWKKWGTPGQEMDLNLDAISLTGYAEGIVEAK